MKAETSKYAARRPIPEHITTTRTFAVRRGAYALTGTSKSGGICHHCSTWTCASP